MQNRIMSPSRISIYHQQQKRDRDKRKGIRPEGSHDITVEKSVNQPLTTTTGALQTGQLMKQALWSKPVPNRVKHKIIHKDCYQHHHYSQRPD